MNQAISMTIGEVAKRARVAPSTLRYYEHVGLLSADSRQSGQRRYNSAALRKLGYIQVAQQAGFTLEEIKTLLHGFTEDTPLGERWQQLAQAKLGELDALISKAHEMKRVLELGLNCGCTSLDTCDLAAVTASSVAGMK